MKLFLALFSVLFLGCASMAERTIDHSRTPHPADNSYLEHSNEVLVQIIRKTEVELQAARDEIKAERKHIGKLPPELTAKIQRARAATYADPAYIRAEKQWRALKLRKDLEAAVWERNILSNHNIGDIRSGEN